MHGELKVTSSTETAHLASLLQIVSFALRVGALNWEPSFRKSREQVFNQCTQHMFGGISDTSNHETIL